MSFTLLECVSTMPDVPLIATNFLFSKSLILYKKAATYGSTGGRSSMKRRWSGQKTWWVTCFLNWQTIDWPTYSIENTIRNWTTEQHFQNHCNTHHWRLHTGKLASSYENFLMTMMTTAWRIQPQHQSPVKHGMTSSMATSIPRISLDLVCRLSNGGLNAARYPIWASLACDYLSVMATSISSKLAFLSAGITISKCYNWLKGDIVEALQCLKCLICCDLLFREDPSVLSEIAAVNNIASVLLVSQEEGAGEGWDELIGGCRWTYWSRLRRRWRRCHYDFVWLIYMFL